MNKKLKAKVPRVVIVTLALVLVIGLFMIVKADSSLIDKIAQYAGQIIGNNISQKLNDSGALDVEQAEQIFGGPISNVNYEVNNGEVVYHLSGDFINGSTTIVSFASPFLMATTSPADIVVKGTYPNGYTVATSTVEMLRLNITGVATSTFTVACGASATSGYNGAPSNSYTILSSDSVATSSITAIENNITSSYGTSVGGGSVAKIMLNSTHPYLTCVITTVYAGAFTEATNTFDGTFVARVSKNQ